VITEAGTDPEVAGLIYVSTLASGRERVHRGAVRWNLGAPGVVLEPQSDASVS